MCRPQHHTIIAGDNFSKKGGQMAHVSHAKRVVVLGLLMSMLLVYAALAGNTSTASYDSPNSVTRRMYINSLDDQVTMRGAQTPQWVSDILVKALDDKSPVVVDAAVYQIGVFEISNLSTRLIALYNEVEKVYASAYARRIQYSIIPALGKLGGRDASAFLSNLLADDMGTPMGEFLLSAIKELGNSSLIGAVKQYKVKMENMVAFAKGKNYDPLIYSRKLLYIDRALDVEKYLAALKGGK
jgi:hypothetical protein